jgi:hypothetical protein
LINDGNVRRRKSKSRNNNFRGKQERLINGN